MLTVNDRPHPYTKGMRLAELAAEVKPGADILLVNDTRMPADTLLRDGDICTLIKTGEIPSSLDMKRTLEARHSPEFQHRFRRASVAIMGLGGLGSAVALSLVKIGIGKLIISDYDVVVLSNIHRQHYFIDQIGLKKTTALKKTLVRINPFTAVTTVDSRLSEQSIPRLFSHVDVLVECFDDPAMKAAALRAALKHMPGTAYVGASGVAGYGSGNSIVSSRIRPRVYIVGDKEADVAKHHTLFAPRVGIAAHHQANQVIRLLMDIDEE
jgi:sulfur carrier protein ThiS adenylyltransferase